MLCFRQELGGSDEWGRRVATMLGHEIRPDAVEHAPSEDVVEIGVSEGGRANAAYAPAVILDAESIDDASVRRLIESCGATADGEYEGRQSMEHRLDVLGFEFRVPPGVGIRVVAVHGQERAFVERVI